MVEVRVHLGHSEKRRNPRITPYIFTAKGKHKRKGIKITHLARSLSEACDLLFHAASQGKNILMIPSQKEQLSSVSCNKGSVSFCEYKKGWYVMGGH